MESTTHRNRSPLAFAIGAALASAAAMYFLDPQSGRRRRALTRDQLRSVVGSGSRFARKARADALNRTQGLIHQARAKVHRSSPADETLEHRVRAALGRLSSHPRAIEVSCKAGVAHLSGDVLSADAERVLQGVRAVPGVTDVVDELREHEDATGIPALQGAPNPERLARRFEYLQHNWSPAPRVLAAGVGAALIGGGVGRNPVTGAVCGLAGSALLMRSLINEPLSEIFGLPSSVRGGLLVQKTLHVQLAPSEAYALWRDFETFPSFMTHVREITRLDDRRYRWKVDGPGDIPVEWVAEVTEDVPGERLAWRTTPESLVESSGVVRFERDGESGTRIHVRMSYRPPGNALGHMVAKLFGRDPKHQIDDDLLRFKSLAETGRATGNEGTVMRH